MLSHVRIAVVFASMAALCAVGTTGQTHAASTVPSGDGVAQSYSKLPLSFEVNRGQADSQVRYLSRGHGYTLLLTDSAAVLALTRTISPATDNNESKPREPGVHDRPADAHIVDIVRMELVGASRSANVEGMDQLIGTSNYFIGNDPAKWHTDVPTYAKVKFAGVYPGIDLIYYGNQSRLEYDFTVAPGADPRSILLHFRGDTRLKLGGTGVLRVIAADGEIVFHKPAVYQMKAGIQQPVQGSFRLLTGNRVGFLLGRYDRAKPLVIDPMLVYSTYLGGTNQGLAGGDYADAIAVDSSGNAYVTGQAVSIDFPLTAGAYQTEYANTPQTFVSKLNPAGTALIYSTYLCGSGGDYGTGIAVDAAGNAYITGVATSPDFPIKGGVQSANSGGAAGTAFVTKLNTTGTALIYSTFLGGSGINKAVAIALDSSDDAYVTGYTYATDFPVTQGAFQPVKNASDGYNAFITKLNPQGSALSYSTYLGGSGSDQATSIAVNSSGVAYVTGQTRSTDFPVTSGAFQITLNVQNLSDGGSAFVTALGASGSSLAYSTYLGGTYTEAGSGIKVDSSGNAYVTGYTYSNDFPVTPGAFQTVKASSVIGNAFVTKLNPSGTALVYSTFLGGGNLGVYHKDYGSAIAVDQLGNAFVTGSEQSNDFPVTSNALQTTDPSVPEGTYDNAFVSELNPRGTGLLYSTYFGGSQGNYGNAIAVDGSGDAYFAGQAFSSNLPTTTGAFQTSNPAAAYGGSDGFVAKLSFGPSPATLITPSPGSTLSGTEATTFTWTTGIEVTSYKLLLGTTGAGSDDLYNSGVTKSLAESVGPLPSNGVTVFATLYSLIDGVWQHLNYTFTEAGTPVPPSLTSPASGTLLSGPTAFQWNPGVGAARCMLYVGTTGVGANDIYNSGSVAITVTSETVTIPVNGVTVFVRLNYELNGAWHHIDYTFTEAGTPVPPSLISPSLGTLLSGSTAFQWNPGVGAARFMLYVGTTGVGADNIYNSGSVANSVTSESVTIPANGGEIYVRLNYLLDGTWRHLDYTFVESGTPIAPILLTPTPGSTLTGANGIFTWSTGTGVSLYQLWLGSTAPNSKNLYNSGDTSSTSANVTGLPLTGITIYATLSALIDGTWRSSSYTYTTQNATLLPQTESILYAFTGNGNGTSDGWSPSGELVMDSQGNLYRTTVNGGSNRYGAVFKISPTGQETILYSFTDNLDGNSPYGGLIMDAQGNLYGITGGGPCNAANGFCYGYFGGAVFKVTPEGAETTLYTFPPYGANGASAQDGLVMDSSGNLYGTTTTGGNVGRGTVFEVTPGGTETVLYSFTGPDGWDPGGEDVTGGSNGGPGLAMDAAGNLYGTTYVGGANNEGVVFKLAPNGSGGYTETVLHSFANNGTDGYGPLGGLVFDSQGNLSGITAYGGAFGPVGGTIFKITPGGVESVLYNFNSNSLVYGVQPGLVIDSHQNLYGSIGGDGSIYDGLVFQLAPTGVLTILHDFPFSSPVSEHGIDPQGGLLLTSNGNLYGTTSSDSVYSSGTVFKLAPSASTVAAPVFSVAPGTYSSMQTIAITDATPGATIYYSVNGQIPLSSGAGTFYNGPVTIGSTSVLSAIAVAPDGTLSRPIQANYIIGSAP